MRRLLVKRFESSFGAFKCSIDNFERVHECVLAFIENSGGKYILDRKLIEKIYEDDIDEIEVALADFADKLKKEKNPKDNRIYNVRQFDLADELGIGVDDRYVIVFAHEIGGNVIADLPGAADDKTH